MSERAPWAADRELDTPRAARAIAEALPELDASEVRLLGSGWDFDVYEADRRWLFRFPRRATEQVRLERDLVLLPWLADHLDAPLPRYRWGMLRAPSFPYAFAGYEKLEGALLADVPPTTIDVEVLGAGLGDLLRRLHALEPPAAVIEGAELDRKTRHEAEPYRAGIRKYLEGFPAFAPALAERAERFFDDPDVLPAPTTLCRLIHDDLHPEHVLLDLEPPYRITGLLDWSDTGLADPAREFGCLYPWGGDPFLRALLDAYGSADPALEARSRFYGICLSFVDIHHALRTGQEARAQWTLPILDAALQA